jgi:hypothetical protein
LGKHDRLIDIDAAMAEQDRPEIAQRPNLILIGIGIGVLVGALCASGLMVSVCSSPDPDLPCDLSTGGLLLMLLVLVGMLICGSIGALITFGASRQQ